ncbi:spore gernimation protein GerPD [Cohnella lubricantis]|uniref:Spore gernimation protein GerPD n=1 Tax=Cohnella lubricantis TaxID=2163172 RepID=A0A841T8Q5_9BACL|nr:spore gernimation protein GerPD [Cohnella lubricantis]MBB6676436.1 spore gernimation protein GerPD [Cohnella lubricantis]
MNVSNGPVQIGVIRVTGIASSSSMLLGDTESITQYSYFDTPPESVIIGPMVPLPPPPEEDAT